MKWNLYRSMMRMASMVVLLVVIAGMPLAAQTPDESLDGYQAGGVSEAATASGSGAVKHEATKSYLGRVIGVLAGLTLGPVGAIGGYVLGDYLDKMNDERRRLETMTRPDIDSVEAWKTFLYKKYGVTAIDADSRDFTKEVEGTGNTNNASRWAKQELEYAGEVFENLPKEFYEQAVNRLVRVASCGGYIGCVYPNHPKTLFIFDPAYAEDKPERERKMFYHAVMIHEMTHGFQSSPRGKQMEDAFGKGFWIFASDGRSPVGADAGQRFAKVIPPPMEVNHRTQVFDYQAPATPPARITLQAKMYPLGAGVSAYGSRSLNWLDPWNTYTDAAGRTYTGYHWAKEDMAECMALLFTGSGFMRQAFPQRFAYFARQFPQLAAHPGRHPEEVLKDNFFKWCGINGLPCFRIMNEHFPYLLYTFNGVTDWVFVPNVTAGNEGTTFIAPSDEESPGFAEFLRDAFKRDLPGPADTEFQ